MSNQEKDSARRNHRPTDGQIMKSLQPGERRYDQYQALIDAGFENAELFALGSIAERDIQKWEYEIETERLPDLLDDLRALVEHLVGRRMATLDQIVAWFRFPNEHLDGKRPIDDIGRFECILSAADRTLRI